MQAFRTINYLSKIFPSSVKKNATESSGNNLFFNGKVFLSRCPGNFALLYQVLIKFFIPLANEIMRDHSVVLGSFADGVVYTEFRGCGVPGATGRGVLFAMLSGSTSFGKIVFMHHNACKKL